jgi:hypothetical protein
MFVQELLKFLASLAYHKSRNLSIALSRNFRKAKKDCIFPRKNGTISLPGGFYRTRGEEMKAANAAIDRRKLYTSTQVRKLLGISGSTLSSLVEKAVIEKITPPGYKQGFYTRASVDEYRKQQELFTEAYKAKQDRRLTVRSAQRDDQDSILEMEKEVLGATVPLDRRLEWQIKNPNIDFIATLNDEVIGHMSLLPLKEKALLAMLKGEIRGWEIPAEEVEVYELGKQYNLFIMALAVKQLENRPSSMYAALILREAQRFLFEIADKQILVKAIYAVSRTRDGIYMAERFEMEPIKMWSTPRRKCFVLDMGNSNAKWARLYREHVASLRLPQEITKGILSEDEPPHTALPSDSKTDSVSIAQHFPTLPNDKQPKQQSVRRHNVNVAQ